MEEPDFDELTWMALDQQEMGDEPQFADELDPDDFLDDAAPPAVVYRRNLKCEPESLKNCVRSWSVWF
ncbi:hypothetical protein R1flu_023328 [Riccia fluitans]|uniref:Uncharacterized protein n=1 Tax=Riccia fluitans TaxID=41844 RepID=A0ABD1XUR9_9MARC